MRFIAYCLKGDREHPTTLHILDPLPTFSGLTLQTLSARAVPFSGRADFAALYGSFFAMSANSRSVKARIVIVRAFPRELTANAVVAAVSSFGHSTTDTRS